MLYSKIDLSFNMLILQLYKLIVIPVKECYLNSVKPPNMQNINIKVVVMHERCCLKKETVALRKRRSIRSGVIKEYC